MQRPRTGHVRTVALGAVVGLCLIVPLAAASADSAGPDKGRHTADSGPTTRPSAAKAAEFGNGVGDRDRPGSAGLLELIGGKPTAKSSATAGTLPVVGTESVCGKAVDGPQGVRAQTCVERDGSEAWGRVYYRNPTPDPLLLVMSVLQPGGNTLRVTCTVEPKDGEGRCDSPRVRVPKDIQGWSAVAELASKDGSTKLLRSGSATTQR
ncbi:hypothetical protein OG948_18155 [Embleya sp. NBC_00888]|uniref:hypothetical protein n=1 Tax=Embleya sp. NBC_00888 TaxID=2975960 RepID=UPI003867415F|nr:hypothetical protein OG948_18155 [Embleya sp. NBC_00888]